VSRRMPPTQAVAGGRRRVTPCGRGSACGTPAVASGPPQPVTGKLTDRLINVSNASSVSTPPDNGDITPHPAAGAPTLHRAEPVPTASRTEPRTMSAASLRQRPRPSRLRTVSWPPPRYAQPQTLSASSATVVHGPSASGSVYPCGPRLPLPSLPHA